MLPLIALIAASPGILTVRCDRSPAKVILSYNPDATTTGFIRAGVLQDGRVISSRETGRWVEGGLSKTNDQRLREAIERSHSIASGRRWSGRTPDGPTYKIVFCDSTNSREYVIHGLLEPTSGPFHEEVERVRAKVPTALVDLIDLLLRAPLERSAPFVPTEGFTVALQRGHVPDDILCDWPTGWPFPSDANEIQPGPYDVNTRYRVALEATQAAAIREWSMRCPSRWVKIRHRSLFVVFDLAIGGYSPGR